MTTLIIGGTSGLGLELAKKYQEEGDEVILVGRKDPQMQGMQFVQFDLRQGEGLQAAVDTCVAELPKINNLVYAAGFYQEGTVTNLQPKDINNMLDVKLHGAIWFVRELLEKQAELLSFVAITSSSQFIARKLEPIYNAANAGLGLFADAASLDGRIAKTLVVAPGGMKTAFWQMTGRDTSSDNDPTWVAGQIMAAMKEEFSFELISIPRNPPSVEIIDKR